MPNIVKLLRSVVAGNRPTGRAYGEPYVNMADNQFGVINNSGNAQDLVGVPIFSTLASYLVGQPVNYQNQLYSALVAVSPGAWNPSQWALNPTKGYVDNGDASTLSQASLLVTGNQGWGGFVNKLRNPGFDIWQRGTAITPSSSGQYLADGWFLSYTGTIPAAVSLVGKIGVSRGSLQMTGAAGNTQWQIIQRIESYVAATLTGSGVGQTVTFQARVFNQSGAALTPQLVAVHPNAQDNYTAYTVDLPATNLQTIANGAVGTVAYTFAIPANGAINGYQIALEFPGLAASTTVAISDCDFRATPGVPVGLNANPPPPELRPIAIELAFCQRYFWDSQGGGGAAAGMVMGAYSGNTGNYNITVTRFPVVMRASPTLVLRNQTYTNCSGLAATASGTGGYWNNVTVTAAGYFAINYNITASAEL